MADINTEGTAFFSAETLIAARVTTNAAGGPLVIDKAGAKVLKSFSEIKVEGDVQTATKRGDNRVRDSISYYGDRKATVTVGRFTPDALAYITGTEVTEVTAFNDTDKDGHIEWSLGRDMDYPEIVLIALSGSGAGNSGNQAVVIGVCKVSSPPPVSLSDEEFSDFEIEVTITDPEGTGATAQWQRVAIFQTKQTDVATVLDKLYPTGA